MPFVVGIVLALATAVFARGVGLDRDRAFYPTVLIVIATYYILFAAMGGSVHTLLSEAMLVTALLIAAVVGYKTSLWIVVVALVAHGVLDAFHGNVVENPGVPLWWPAFCLAYDVGFAGCLAWLLRAPTK